MNLKQWKKLMEGMPKEIVDLPVDVALEHINQANSKCKRTAVDRAKEEQCRLENSYKLGELTPKELAHEIALVWILAEIDVTDFTGKIPGEIE